MIVDSFPFFQELDLLEVRLTVMDPIVDRFVIVEGTRTYAGAPKPLRLLENKDRYAKWWHKIDYIVVDDWPVTDDPWVTENHQRNSLARGWARLKDDDVIISTDLDEIPKPETVMRYAGMKGVKWFLQQDYRNFFNARNADEPLWFGGPRMLTYGEFRRLGELKKYKYCKFSPREVNQGATAVKLRRMRNVILLPDGGWHFSFLGGVEAIIKKIQAYSHQERNTPEFLDRNRLMNALAEGKTVVGEQRLCTCPVEELGLPDDALAVVRRFPHLIAPLQSDDVRRRLERIRGCNAFKQRFVRRYIERRIRLFFARHGIYYRMVR